MSERRTRPRLAALSAAYLGGFVALYFVAVCTSVGQLVDASSLGVLGWLRSDAWLAFYDGRDIVMYGVVATAAVAALTCMIERRITPVAYSAGLLVLVAAAAVLLKEFLPRPHLGDFAYAENTFPSGHTAITLAAAVAIVWCGPRWMSRILVVVLGMLVSFVALASVLSFAHRASDSLGGVLLAGTVSCALAAVAGQPAEPPSPVRSTTGVVGFACLVIGLLCLPLAAGMWGDDYRAVALSVAVLLGTVGAVASVLAVHRPIPQLRRDRQLVSRTAHSDEGL